MARQQLFTGRSAVYPKLSTNCPKTITQSPGRYRHCVCCTLNPLRHRTVRSKLRQEEDYTCILIKSSVDFDRVGGVSGHRAARDTAQTLGSPFA